MLAPEIPARHVVARVNEDWLSAAEEQGASEEPWRPARDISLMRWRPSR